jgi:hypothetical protein
MNVFIRSWGKSVDGANFVGTHFLFLQNSEQKSYFSTWIVCVELAGRAAHRDLSKSDEKKKSTTFAAKNGFSSDPFHIILAVKTP